jgi:hypothetical protein
MNMFNKTNKDSFVGSKSKVLSAQQIAVRNTSTAAGTHKQGADATSVRCHRKRIL